MSVIGLPIPVKGQPSIDPAGSIGSAIEDDVAVTAGAIECSAGPPR